MQDARCECRESSSLPVYQSSSRKKYKIYLVFSRWYLVFSEEKIKREIRYKMHINVERIGAGNKCGKRWFLVISF